MTDLIARLARPETVHELAASAYWPKWDSAWWWITFMWEQGELAQVPPGALRALVETVGRDSLPFFATDASQVPAGVEPNCACQCHCALGTVYQLAVAGGLPVDTLIPWARPWFARYQLPDGGWNCDEQVYGRETPRSSLVSTLPILESLLVVPGGRTLAEDATLDRGADYLLARRLHRSISGGGQVIRAEWLQPIIPRFYEYDVLRGARFLARWAIARGRSLPADAIAEVMATLTAWAADGCKPRAWLHTEGTLVPGDWDQLVRPAPTFAQLDQASDPAQPNPWLRREWDGLLADLAATDSLSSVPL
jgi:hypothetical protein